MDLILSTPEKHRSPYLKKLLVELVNKKPNLTEKHRMALSAFYVLDRERERVGQSAWPMHIKQKSVIDYITINGSHGFESDILMSIITQLDECHLKMYADKQKAEAKKHG